MKFKIGDTVLRSPAGRINGRLYDKHLLTIKGVITDYRYEMYKDGTEEPIPYVQWEDNRSYTYHEFELVLVPEPNDLLKELL